MIYRLVSYNIHKGMDHFSRNFVLDKQLALIKSVDPDFVCLQEVLSHSKNQTYRIKNQADYIIRELGYPYHAFSNHAHYKKNSLGNLILARYPILKTKTLDLPSHPREQRCVLSAFIDRNEARGGFWILCTHLNLSHYHRKKQYETIKSLIKDEDMNRFVLVGDFNDWSKKACQFLDPIKEVSTQLGINFLKTFPSMLPRLSLDRVYSDGVTSLDLHVLKGGGVSYLSDHLPICYEFRL